MRRSSKVTSRAGSRTEYGPIARFLLAQLTVWLNRVLDGLGLSISNPSLRFRADGLLHIVPGEQTPSNALGDRLPHEIGSHGIRGAVEDGPERGRHLDRSLPGDVGLAEIGVQ